METSGGGAGFGHRVGIDVHCCVGTIVWVRRRNGSWWPGRILGPEELSASHLLSPRSGTPVKLLGREDASVDWYNLEKSKRVKAFRCGEFDACIEKAEALQNIPIKKREKYARREDAILHALELEKQQVELNQHKLSSTIKVMSSRRPSASKRDSNILSSTETRMKHHKLLNNGKQLSPKVENLIEKVSFHEENDNDPHLIQKGSDIQKLSSEDDNGEIIPRMRGLQDFGFRMAHSKRKSSSYVSWENSQKCIDDHVEYLTNSGCMMERAGQAGTIAVPTKGKRSTVGDNDEILAKKRDRRRPLVQVMQSTVKLPQHAELGSNANGIPIAEEMDHMGSTYRAKRSRCIYLPANLDNHAVHDGLVSEPMPGSKNHFEICYGIDHSGNVSEECSSSLIEASDSDNLETGFFEPDVVEQSNMLRGRFRDEIPLSGLVTELHGPTKKVPSEMGVSKWYMKGKRNIRNVGKRLMGGSGAKTSCASIVKCNVYRNPETYRSTGRHLKFSKAGKSTKNSVEPALKDEFQNADEGDPIDMDSFQNKSTVYGNRKSVLEQFDLTSNALGEEHVDHHDKVYGSDSSKETEALLVDVDLKVQATYQGEHVPLVSLMSRLNGKAIIGHPVQIEILEDGCASHLASKFHAIVDDSTAPSAMWHTARRTAMQRVPRSIPSATFEELDAADLFQYSEPESKPLLHKIVYPEDLNHHKKRKKKRVSLNRSELVKFQKKNINRVSSPGQKTRKLSSLASDEKIGAGLGRINVESNVCIHSLLISELSRPHVTCVPVKVVFSRILEAVGRPSSLAPHCATMNIL
ncbi:hypothetical protein HPP92_001515 [Vanilla planifolia]|uniref:PWWP domain-containing protein n=1 Tax=Vanilla planifolia TaxID=51239 RepID=A0A835VDM3_VANPL|nr:hypothetical protein HPP92_001515 [Vanilla planifolia]